MRPATQKDETTDAKIRKKADNQHITRHYQQTGVTSGCIQNKKADTLRMSALCVYQSMTPVFTNPKYTSPKSPAFQP